MGKTMIFETPLDAWAIGVTVAATLMDLSSRRIPNYLTVTAALVGLSGQMALSGLPGFWDGLAGMGVAILLFFPFFMVRWMGAGDVKLLMAIGVTLGWRMELLVSVGSLMVGLITSLAFLMLKGELWTYLKRYGLMLRGLLTTGQLVYIPPLSHEAANIRFPYALAIAMGTFFAVFTPASWLASMGLAAVIPDQ